MKTLIQYFPKKAFIHLILLVIAFKLNAQIDLNAYQNVKNLYGNLKEVSNSSKFLFGQEFFNSYSWNGGNHENETISDCYEVTGKHPAVLGQDFLYYIYKDTTEKRKHLEAAKKAYKYGCVITFDFHMPGMYGKSYEYSSADKYLMYKIGNNSYNEVTWFKKELQKVVNIINNELQMPVVLRLFHEMNGDWFWWGTKAYGGSTSYKKMFQLAVNYIKDRTNYVLLAWSPNYTWTTTYYPGNSYVDIIGLDLYDQGTTYLKPSLSTMVNQLSLMTDYAKLNNKVPVFSETGNRIGSADKYPDWWLNVYNSIQANVKAKRIAWMLTWINVQWPNSTSTQVPFTPHKNSTTLAKSKFYSFINQSNLMMYTDAKLHNMYDESPFKSAEIDNITEIENPFNNILVYPNPSKDGNFKVNFTSMNDKEVRIQVTDLLGRLVFEKSNITDNSFPLCLSHIGKGFYIINISNEDINKSIKVLIE